MHTHTKGTLSFDSIPHGHHHVIHALHLQMNTSRSLLLPHLQATTCRTRMGNLLRTTLRNTRWSSQYEQQFVYVPRLPNSLTTVEEGNFSGPIRTSHNSHTHTCNTRQSEPQLKECSYSPVPYSLDKYSPRTGTHIRQVSVMRVLVYIFHICGYPRVPVGIYKII